jgi:ankyrin repeat protein
LVKATPLWLAAHYNRTSVIDFLVENGVSLDEVNDMHQTALMAAVANQSLNAIECLVKHGADIHSLDKEV